jgi:hypothetical protein
MSSNCGFLQSPEASGCADRYARRRPNVQTITATVPAPTTSAATTATSITNIVGTSMGTSAGSGVGFIP